MKNVNDILCGSPLFMKGLVVKGFGRGSKDLGIPTANFSEEVVAALPEQFPTGVYYAWARIDNGDVHKAVLSVGYNPFYKNKTKSIETHIIHQFDNDFYGQCLRIVFCGYTRPQENYTSKEELIAAIKNDIKEANENLDKKEHVAARNMDDLQSDLTT